MKTTVLVKASLFKRILQLLANEEDPLYYFKRSAHVFIRLKVNIKRGRISASCHRKHSYIKRRICEYETFFRQIYQSSIDDEALDSVVERLMRVFLNCSHKRMKYRSLTQCWSPNSANSHQVVHGLITLMLFLQLTLELSNVVCFTPV